MKRARQTKFSFIKKVKKEHGGDHAKGRRKIARPLETKKSLHVVLRASKAVQKHSMLREIYKSKIDQIIYKTAKNNGVRVYNSANVGNHIHLIVKARTKRGFQNYLRTITARIAVLVTGAVKGKPFGKFWDALAFTRIVEWGKDFIQTQIYLTKNLFEGEGILLKSGDRKIRRYRV